MLTIRQANLKDVPTLLSLIREMAEYEKLPLLITEQTLANDGFGSHTRFRVLIAEYDGEPAGYAFFFDSYSTFQGRGLFLEKDWQESMGRGGRCKSDPGGPEV